MNKLLIKFSDKYIGSNLCKVLSFFPEWPNELSLQKNINIKRILIIRPGGLGDFLYLLPTIKILKDYYPDVDIDVLCEKRNWQAALFTTSIRKLILYDEKPWELFWKLRRNSYDVVIDTEQIHYSSSIFAWLTGAFVRIGFKNHPERNNFYTHLVNYYLDAPESDMFLALLEPLGIKGTKLEMCYDPYIYLDLPVGIVENLPELVRYIKSSHKEYWVMGIKGKARYRSWPVEYYVQFITRVVKASNLPVLLVGGVDDIELAGKIRSNLTGTKCYNLVGKTSVIELASILLNSAFFVGIDSGASVLANLLDIKRVLIFGCADSNKWTIRTQKLKVVNASLPCSPCQVFGQHKRCRNILCMQRTTPDIVVKAVLNFTL